MGINAGMPADSFVTMIKETAKKYGIPLRGAVDVEFICSLGEMGIIGRTQEDTGELRFRMGDLQELERFEILPKGFFRRLINGGLLNLKKY